MELTPDMIEPVYTHIGTRPAANVEAEPVAWLYERNGKVVFSAARDVLHHGRNPRRTRREAMSKENAKTFARSGNV